MYGGRDVVVVAQGHVEGWCGGGGVGMCGAYRDGVMVV